MSATGSVVEQLGLGRFREPAPAAEGNEAAPAAEVQNEAAPAALQKPRATSNTPPLETSKPPVTEDKEAAPPLKAAKKKRAKKKRGRKPAVAKQVQDRSLMGNLSAQLAELHKEASEVERINATKAALRSAKAQFTQLKKFAGVVASTLEAVEKQISDLESKLPEKASASAAE